MKKLLLPSSLVIVMFLLFNVVQAQEEKKEHPQEHPQEGSKEHPEKQKPLNIEDFAKEVENYIANETKLKGGFFMVYDKDQKKTLTLTLDKVHKERLSKLKDNEYFVCADFKATDNHTYDLDIFMEQTEHGLKTTQILVHKVDGVARYSWIKEGDHWKPKY